MSKKSYFIVMIAVAIFALVFAAGVQAEVLLFQDIFDGADNNDGNYGLNDNLANRQTGALINPGTSTYVNWARGVGGTTTDSNNQVNNAADGPGMLTSRGTGNWNNSSCVLIDHNFVDSAITGGGGFTLRFDMDPVAASTVKNAHGHSCSVFIGAANSTQAGATKFEHYDYNVDFGLAIMDYGQMHITHNSAWVKTGQEYDAARWALVGTNNSSNYAQKYTFELRVATDSFAEGESATVQFWVMAKEGDLTWVPTQIDVNGAEDGLDYTFDWDANGTNYIGFGEGGCYTTTVSQVDNVSITGWGQIPEPSTLALLAAGLVGLLAYAWKKRK